MSYKSEKYFKYNILKLADKYLEDYKVVSSGKELTTECFFCYPKSSKKKLTINLESGLWHCWKCGKKGNLHQFAEELRKFNKAVDLSDFENKDEEKKKDVKTKKIEEITWPEHFYFFTKSARNDSARLAKEYLHNRGITDNLIDIYKIGYCTYGLYANRVVVPIFYKGKLVSFIARDFTGKASKRILTPPGLGGPGIKQYIYRIEEAAKLGHLIITEGVFSAISCGPRGVALFGKTPTSHQIAQIIAVKPSRVTVALDPDALPEAKRLAKTLLLYCSDVRLARFPEGEDPNSLPKLELEECLSKAEPVKNIDILEGIKL